MFIIKKKELFLGHIPGCAYTICQYGQALISSTITNGSPFPF